jgi:hypothetical protein
MKLVREYLIKIDGEFEDELTGPLGMLTLKISGSTIKTVKGTIVMVPMEHYGPPEPGHAETLMDGGWCMGYLAATTKGRVWHESCIQDKLNEGDVVWFELQSNSYHNHMDYAGYKNHLRIRPANILAYQQDGVVKPYKGSVFIKRDRYELSKRIILLNGQKATSFTEGVVAGNLGEPLRGLRHTVKVGDKVSYDPAYNVALDLPEIGPVVVVPSVKMAAKWEGEK